MMKNKALMVTLSMAMVLGLAGAVNATTFDSSTTNMQPKTTYAQAYMDNNDVTSTEVEKVETTQPDQTVPSKTDVYDQMMSSNHTMNNQMQNMATDPQMQNMFENAQMQNMSMDDQMKNMPMNTQRNGQVNNSKHIQGMAGTNNLNDSKASQQPSQKSSSQNRMGSMGRMGR
ncbi:MAG TPA: hypothetical protein DEF42_02175 [Desulfosporosinus sp.]|nr:hypothetical protein [Desulfosporosinus sp.]